VNILKQIQKKLILDGIDYYLVDTFDPHGSEYINDYYKLRQYFSGFTGSNGLLIVMQKDAYLWTDGRYFVQAAGELYKGIKLMKMGEKGVPTVREFISKNIKKNQILALDGELISCKLGQDLAKICEDKKAIFNSKVNLANDYWMDRPGIKYSKAFILGEEYTGLSASKKIKNVRKTLSGKALFVAKLDDIMWLTNLRGADIECNPCCYSYLLLDDKVCQLFINKSALAPKTKAYLKDEGIDVADYRDVEDVLKAYIENHVNVADKELTYDSASLNYKLYEVVSTAKKHSDSPSIIESMKSIKNSTEIRNLKDAYLMDSVVVTRFIKYIKEHANDQLTETEAAEYIDKLRSKLPGFIELSFPTIAAYGANAAMMHYEATKEAESVIKPEGMLLVDSGGQYKTGTTDVTRTIVVGPISDKVKKDYTLSVCGMLRLLNSVFMDGCTGRNLDILARGPLWKEGTDYKCGTGHGIGFCLNVHEGPHRIGWQKGRGTDPALKPGMIVSDEPGVYIEGEYGIRIENILLVKKYKSTSDGDFLCFESLTLAPIDLDAIDTKYMSSEDIDNLNRYHKLVFKKISPFLNKSEQKWLENNTKIV